MDLHQMFNTAVADLPDLPDQVPTAERIHHRRTSARRSTTIALAAALVVGVGTLTIASPWSSHPSAKTVQVAGAPAPTPSGPSTEPYFQGTPLTPPALSGVTLTGAKLTASYTGHVTVIVVWGSWCTPCRAEAPILAQAYLKYRSKGVQFLGLDVRDDNAAALSFEHEYGIDYPSLRDPHATLAKGFSPLVTANSVPSLVFIDRNGKMQTSISGGETAKGLDTMITDTLAATY
jgi:thiol-disulfide isomerase/thioredoxin